MTDVSQSNIPELETVELTEITAMTLQRLRSYPPDVDVEALGAQLDHVRLNALLVKGLAQWVGYGLWRATERGRTVAIRVKPGRKR